MSNLKDKYKWEFLAELEEYFNFDSTRDTVTANWKDMENLSEMFEEYLENYEKERFG